MSQAILVRNCADGSLYPARYANLLMSFQFGYADDHVALKNSSTYDVRMSTRLVTTLDALWVIIHDPESWKMARFVEFLEKTFVLQFYINRVVASLGVKLRPNSAESASSHDVPTKVNEAD